MDKTEQRILQIIDAQSDKLISMGNYLFTHAERGFNEKNTSAFVAGELKKLGLNPDTGLAGTGLRASIGQQSGVNLALISELDGIICPSHPQAAPDGMSHACGHHAQMIAMLGAAMALTDPEVAETLGGQATFFAVPAEEFLSEDIRCGLRESGISTHSGGKAELLSRGCFDDIDLSITSHAHLIPNGEADLVLGSNACTGFIGKTAVFHGKAAHAAGAPHEGINAMNAAALSLSALGLIRETFQEKDYVRVHPIMREAGTAVNVVPDRAVLDMMVRAGSLAAVSKISKQVDRAFKGSAYAIGAEVEIHDVPGYLPVIESLPEQVMTEAAALLGDSVKAVSIIPGLENMTSTDVGDLTHLMPVLNFTFGGFTGSLHSREFQMVNSEKALVVPAKFMALTAYKLLKNQAEQAKAILGRFTPALSKEEYLAYINS